MGVRWLKKYGQVLTLLPGSDKIILNVATSVK